MFGEADFDATAKHEIFLLKIKGGKMTLGVDWDVIEEFEGNIAFGYAIPKDEKSGITIGMGFDLGQHSIQQIDEMPFPENLRVKLRPYAGLVGAAARNTLYLAPADSAFDPRRPIGTQVVGPTKDVVKIGKFSSAAVLKASGKMRLELGEDEVSAVNEVLKKKKLGAFVRHFDDAASKGGGKPFGTLPTSIQTAIASFFWQYGEYIGKLKPGDRRKQYFDLAASNDRAGVVEILISRFMGPDEIRFRKRRAREIQLFLWGLEKQMPGPLLRQFMDRVEVAARTS